MDSWEVPPPIGKWYFWKRTRIIDRWWQRVLGQFFYQWTFWQSSSLHQSYFPRIANGYSRIASLHISVNIQLECSNQAEPSQFQNNRPNRTKKKNLESPNGGSTNLPKNTAWWNNNTQKPSQTKTNINSNKKNSFNAPNRHLNFVYTRKFNIEYIWLSFFASIY